MTISNLDRDINYNHIVVYRGGNGDIYVTIYEQENEDALRTPHTVRIGMCGSGSRIPGDIMVAFSNLVDVFEKYSDCENEFDAEKKYIREKFKENE